MIFPSQLKISAIFSKTIGNLAKCGQNLDLTQQIFSLTQQKSSSNSKFRQVFASKCRKIVEKITLRIELISRPGKRFPIRELYLSGCIPRVKTEWLGLGGLLGDAGEDDGYASLGRSGLGVNDPLGLRFPQRI